MSGGFDVGDAVDVVAGGALVGKGITNYTAAELRRIKGLHSGDAREVVPRAYEEAVHRDYFVLVELAPMRRTTAILYAWPPWRRRLRASPSLARWRAARRA